jgi:hypothetical protein
MNPFVVSKKQRIINVGVMLVALTAMGEWRAMTPDPNNARQVYDVENHPIASALGAALPAVLLAPVAYWFYGWCMAACANRWASRKEALIEAGRRPGVGRIWSATTSEAGAWSESATSVDDKESWAAWFFGVDMDARAKRMLAEAKRSEPTSDPNSRLESEANFDEEESWAAALSEYESGNRRDGLYAKLYANFEGDESKIKATYLRTRVVEMTQEARKQRDQAREAKTRAAEAPEAKARAAVARALDAAWPPCPPPSPYYRDRAD